MILDGRSSNFRQPSILSKPRGVDGFSYGLGLSCFGCFLGLILMVKISRILGVDGNYQLVILAQI